MKEFFEKLFGIKRKRELHQLYKVLYEQIKHKPCITGLCYEINMLRYSPNRPTFKQLRILRNHFKRNKPTKWKHSKFFNSRDYFGGNGFWWTGASEGTEQRKAFIRKMIEITK